MTAPIDLTTTPLRSAANANMVDNSATSLNMPPGTFPLRKMIEHPIRQVYTALTGPLKSRLNIIGIPVRSHETVPGIRGKGMSKGGPRIISYVAECAPNMVASASFLVSSLCKESSPVEKKMVSVKLYLCFLQNKMSFSLTYVNTVKSSFERFEHTL